MCLAGREPAFKAQPERNLFLVTRILALTGACAYLVAIAITMTDIFIRSIGIGSVHGVTDVTELCIIIGSMLAIPYVFMTDQHVYIELFIAKWSPSTQLVLHVIASLLAVSFLAAVFWYSFGQALSDHKGGDRSQTIGIPVIWYWIPFLTGMGLSVFTTLFQAVLLLRKGETHHHSNEVVL